MRSPAYRDISLLISHMRRIVSAACNKRLALVDSSMPAYRVLVHLVHEQEASQHELASDLGMDRAGVSRLIQDMSRRGQVRVRTDPADKRQRFVRITDKGRQLEATLSPIVDHVLLPFTTGLSASEEQELLRLLRKAHTACLAVLQAEDAAPTNTQRPLSSASGRKQAATPGPGRKTPAGAGKKRGITA